LGQAVVASAALPTCADTKAAQPGGLQDGSRGSKRSETPGQARRGSCTPERGARGPGAPCVSGVLLTLTPAPLSREEGEGQKEVRPHPGPLPQERGRRSRRLWKTTRPGVRAPSGRKGSNATDATEAIELSNSVRKFSLSVGERAGVPRKLSGLPSDGRGGELWWGRNPGRPESFRGCPGLVCVTLSGFLGRERWRRFGVNGRVSRGKKVSASILWLALGRHANPPGCAGTSPVNRGITKRRCGVRARETPGQARRGCCTPERGARSAGAAGVSGLLASLRDAGARRRWTGGLATLRPPASFIPSG
jgi:hypothetical protein